MSAPSGDPGLAVCLASSFCGYHAHTGFLNGLGRLGIRPGKIAGASAGALTGGLWAAGVRGDELEKLMLSFQFKRAFFDLLSIPRFHLLFLNLGPSGVFSGSRLRRFLIRLIGDRRIEDLHDPTLELAVSNLTRNCIQMKKEGSLVDFMIASLAVPLLFTVQRIGNEDYIDGGVANETPFEQWLDDPAIRTIIVHHISHQASRRYLPWWNGSGVAASAHAVAAAELFHKRKQLAAASGKQVIFMETVTIHPGIFQWKTARSLIDAGALTAAGLQEPPGLSSLRPVS